MTIINKRITVNTNINILNIYVFRNLEERDHLKYGMVFET